MERLRTSLEGMLVGSSTVRAPSTSQNTKLKNVAGNVTSEK